MEQRSGSPERLHGRRSLPLIALLACFLFLMHPLQAQVTDTIANAPDSVLVYDGDSLAGDTLPFVKVRPPAEVITSPVRYQAVDSIRFDLRSRMVYMYQQCELHYEQIELKSGFVRINFNDKSLFAKGIADTSGRVVADPVFKEGGEEFSAKEMRYNFDTRKGLISQVITQEGDGYLHGEIIKKLPDDIINIRHGKYTTCNLEHPHFEFRFSRAKVIPDNKIVTGPAYLVISDFPTPLFLPFGLFPNKKGQRSGILLPSYGESANRGFFFENFGYYWGISDYLDLELRGDIYTRGSWAIKTRTGYAKRYKYRGSVGLRYAVNITGDPGSADYSKNRDYAINWSHQQSEKARPNSKFSANVNIVSSKFNQFNPTSANDYLSNTFQSSVAYQTSWAGRYFLTASLNHRQNVINRTFDLTLPELSFSVNRFYPFRSKARVGKLKWYDNISVQYKLNTRNEIQTYDSLLFTDGFLDRFNNGIKHSVPVSSNIKVMKYFNLTNTLNYTERWYGKRIEQDWIDDTLISGTDTTVGYLRKDTATGLFAVRDFSFTSNLSTRVYGMVNFRKGPVTAFRHVMTPSVGFSFRPDFGTPGWDYYDSYVDGSGNERRYSYYSGFIYGTAPDGKSGRINLSLSNNFEMKVRSRQDTVSGTHKVTLIDNLSLTTSYDLAKDSLRWSPLLLSARTRLFRNIDVTYSSRWDPYILDSTGSRNLNQYEWKVNRRLFRFENSSWNFSLNWRLNDDALKRKRTSSEGTAQEVNMVNEDPEAFVDFSVPWNLTLSYNMRYVTNVERATGERDAEVIQTLTFNGDVNITPKWKIGFRSGYDFENKDFSYTSVDIYRDLHCWEMRFNWIPMGARKSWNFTINVKSALLQDLKLNKKKDFRDF